MKRDAVDVKGQYEADWLSKSGCHEILEEQGEIRLALEASMLWLARTLKMLFQSSTMAASYIGRSARIAGVSIFRLLQCATRQRTCSEHSMRNLRLSEIILLRKFVVNY